MASTPLFAGSIKTGLVQILNATGTGKVTAYTAGANGSRVKSLIATSTDTSSRLITVTITRSSTSYDICTYTVAITAGEDGVTSTTNLLASSLCPGLAVDDDGNRYINLQNGDTLQVSSSTTVTSGKIVNIIATAEDI